MARGDAGEMRERLRRGLALALAPDGWVPAIGASYEPLRRLWPLLGDGYRLALIHERVFPDDGVEQERVEDRRLKVSSDADAEAVVDKIAGVVLREAVPFESAIEPPVHRQRW